MADETTTECASRSPTRRLTGDQSTTAKNPNFRDVGAQQVSQRNPPLMIELDRTTGL